MSNDVVSESIFSAFKAFFTKNGRDLLFGFSPGVFFWGEFGEFETVQGSERGIIKKNIKSFYFQANVRKIPTSNGF